MLFRMRANAKFLGGIKNCVSQKNFVFACKTCILLQKYCVTLRNFAFAHKSIQTVFTSFLNKCKTCEREHKSFVSEYKVSCWNTKKICWKVVLNSQTFKVLLQMYWFPRRNFAFVRKSNEIWYFQLIIQKHSFYKRDQDQDESLGKLINIALYF